MTDLTEAQSRPIVSRAEAKAGKLIRYFTGRSCKHGHIAERRVTDKGCIICADIKVRAWNAAHRSELAAKAAAFRTDRADDWQTIKARFRLNAEARAFAAADRGKRRAAVAASRAKHPGTKNAWRKANPGAARLIVQNRRARKLGAEGVCSAVEVAEIRTLQRGKCAICRKTLRRKVDD